MNDTVKLWCFIVLLPVFAAIGHDLYANFYKNDENRVKIEAMQLDQLPVDPKAYKASDFGYLLVHYTPSLYDNLKSSVPEDTWGRWVNPILSLYTIVVAGFPAVIFFIGLLLFNGFKYLGSFGTRQKSNHNSVNDDPLNKRAKEQTYKYKRR